MPSFRYLLVAAVAVLATAGARAADPVVVELNASASVGTTLVTVGDVARVTGGDAGTRERVAKIDLAELKARDHGAAIGRLSLGYRLELAGYDGNAVRVVGAERVTVTQSRRTVTSEEVLAAARAELLRLSPSTPGLAVELAQPIVVKLPEVPAYERVSITARPHGSTTGRVQMDVLITCGTEKLLGLAVHLNVKDPARVVQAVGMGVAANPNEVLVKARQRVEVSINSGGLKVIMVGEAQQDGRLGQTIQVLNTNPDSKKMVAAKVTGPGKLEIELGGTTP
ncbi:MAG TPA: flagella basal body P-ring formation protein FlgA [Gemmata sp.]